MISGRVANIQHLIGLKKIDGFYISNIKNIRYLTGFSGSSGFVLITKDKNLLFTDFRYKEQVNAEVTTNGRRLPEVGAEASGGWEIGTEKGRRLSLLRSLVKKLGINRLGFETSLSYGYFELLKGLPVTLVPQKDIIEGQRVCKDEVEISNINLAVKRAEEAFKKVRPRIRTGIKETEIALRLEEQLKKAGCRNIPFDIIVASGRNSSKPHARPADKKIEAGDFVIIDWGGEANGYYSDITRTLLMSGGNLSGKIQIYNIVNSARKKAVGSVKEGVKSTEIDGVARGIIKSAGFGEFFGHGTGHGVGLEVHEGPRVSWTDSKLVRNGMVFTVEPGIYIPGTGGVRIEDMVTVRKGKGALLTTLGRELEIIK